MHPPDGIAIEMKRPIRAVKYVGISALNPVVSDFDNSRSPARFLALCVLICKQAARYRDNNYVCKTSHILFNIGDTTKVGGSTLLICCRPKFVKILERFPSAEQPGKLIRPPGQSAE